MFGHHHGQRRFRSSEARSRTGRLSALGLVAGTLVAWGGSVDALPEHSSNERVAHAPNRHGQPDELSTYPVSATAAATEPLNAAPAPEARPDPARSARRADGSGQGITPEVAARCLADAWHERHGVPLGPSGLGILWAHWALETGRGHRMVAYNFGGIKGSGPSGDSVRLWTRERDGEIRRRVRRNFRAYETPEAGVRDYLSLLATRYPRALRAASKGRVVDFVHALDQGGYFTDDVRAYQRAMIGLYSEFVDSGRLAEACSR